MRIDHEFSVPASIDEVWQAMLDPERVAPCMPGASLTGVDGDQFTATMKVKLGPISLQYKGTGEFAEKDEAARRLVIKASGKDARGGGTATADVAVTLTEREGETHGAVATDLTVTGRPAQFGRGMISDVGGKLLGQFATCLSEELAGPAAESAASGGEEPAAAEQLAGGGQPTAEDGQPVAANGQATASGAAASGAGASGAGASGAGAGAAAGTTSDAAAGTGAGPAAGPATRSAPSGGAGSGASSQRKEAAPIDLMDVAGAPVFKRLAPVLGAVAALIAIVAIVRACRK